MSNTYSSQSQAEKRIRGENFQEEIRRSWSLIPNCWRMRITDDCGSRPADEIVILPRVNFLIEMKRKANNQLSLSDLRSNQIGGLLDFSRAGLYNHGIIMVSFLNEHTDTAYAIPLRDLLQAMAALKKVSLAEIYFEQSTQCVPLPRILINGEQGYDLRGLVDWLSYPLKR